MLLHRRGQVSERSQVEFLRTDVACVYVTESQLKSLAWLTLVRLL